MTPRHALLLPFLLAAVPARAAAPEVPAPLVEAFVDGRPVRAALEAGAAVPETLAPLLGQAEVVQAGGTAEQDDKKFRAAVLAVADGLGVKGDAKRAALLRLYLDRRATGARAPATPGSAGPTPPDEKAALERAVRLRARVTATKNPFGTREPGAGGPGPGGADGGALRSSSVLPPAGGTGTGESGALRASSVAPGTPSGDGVRARIDAALKARGVQVPEQFKKGPGSVPGLVVGRDGQVSTAGGDPAAATNPDLPALKWNSPLLRPENFNVPYKQDPSKPQSASDIARIEKTFRATIARLVSEGRRLEGTGNGVMNNIWVTFRAKDGARCYEQSEALLADLAKEFHSSNGVGEFVEPRGRWHFKMTTYFGEGHEANGHYWVTATSREPGDPTLILDPWKGEIEKVAEKKPVVAKGYASYWFGYVMDKTVGQ